MTNIKLKIRTVIIFFDTFRFRLYTTDCIQSLKSNLLLVVLFLKKIQKIMETQHKEQVTEFLESMKRLNKFKKLKPENNNDNSFSVKLKVSGYNELNLMVSSLLKASLILLNDDARSQACFPFNEADNNVMTLLEIALQLLPEEEMEVLDDLYKLHLQV